MGMGQQQQFMPQMMPQMMQGGTRTVMGPNGQPQQQMMMMPAPNQQMMQMINPQTGQMQTMQMMPMGPNGQPMVPMQVATPQGMRMMLVPANQCNGGMMMQPANGMAQMQPLPNGGMMMQPLQPANGMMAQPPQMQMRAANSGGMCMPPTMNAIANAPAVAPVTVPATDATVAAEPMAPPSIVVASVHEGAASDVAVPAEIAKAHESVCSSPHSSDTDATTLRTLHSLESQPAAAPSQP